MRTEGKGWLITERSANRSRIGATEHVAIRRDDHFDQPGRGPVFTEQAAQDRLEVRDDLHGPELADAVLAQQGIYTSRFIIFERDDFDLLRLVIQRNLRHREPHRLTVH